MMGNFQIEMRICESVGMLTKFLLFWAIVQYRHKKARERGEEIQPPPNNWDTYDHDDREQYY